MHLALVQYDVIKGRCPRLMTKKTNCDECFSANATVSQSAMQRRPFVMGGVVLNADMKPPPSMFLAAFGSGLTGLPGFLVVKSHILHRCCALVTPSVACPALI